MGPQRGRTLHAHFDGQELVIQRTKFHSFEKEEDAPFSLFFRYLLRKPTEGSGSSGLAPPSESIWKAVLPTHACEHIELETCYFW